MDNTTLCLLSKIKINPNIDTHRGKTTKHKEFRDDLQREKHYLQRKKVSKRGQKDTGIM